MSTAAYLTSKVRCTIWPHEVHSDQAYTACVMLQAFYTRDEPIGLARVALRGPIRKYGGRDEGSCCLLCIALMALELSGHPLS